MSFARSIADLFSKATSGATDAEVTAAISTHNTSANGHVSRGNTASRPASPTIGDFYSNTETGVLEIYESTGWTSVVSPSPPSSVVATDQGNGRAYNNGQASVAFSAGTFSGTTYTITSSPGSYTGSGSTSPITITGLQSSTQYTYTAVASGKYGTSAPSSASAGVTATTVPQAPTIDSVTGGNAQVSVAFTAGATGGSAITGYTVTSNPGSLTASGASSPLVVTGLTNGTSYTFTAVATNANGTSAASSASSSVAPIKMVEVEYLIVAGGGGSGGGGNTGYHSGGGGAGGLRSGSTQLLASTNFQISIGSGGTAGTQSGDSGFIGGNGINSTALGLTAIGGGGGGGNATNAGKGAAGGSGGGGALYATTSGFGVGTSGQGNDGGNGSNSASGGGGGSGGIGGNASSGTGGNAGAGTVSSITGSSVNYAGGGAGRGSSQGGTSNGGTPVNTNGSSNTGNGGGGTLAEAGRAGGSGVVIFKYLTSDGTITIGAGLTGSTSTSGSHTIATITQGTGNVSWA